MSCTDHPEDSSPATLTLAELECVYREAVAHGADLTGLDADDERTAGTLELLAAITVRVPHLTLLLASLADAGEPSAGAACVAREARRQSAAIVRLAHRALEFHARDVGYDPEAWRERALLQASAAAAGCGDVSDELAAAAFELGNASVALSIAITAVATDRMAVPAHVADALGGWLFCYAHARHRACA